MSTAAADGLRRSRHPNLDNLVLARGDLANLLENAPLRALMGKDEMTMFEMTGLLGKHLGPA